MNEIKLDKRNYRKHSDKNKRVIRKSLEELGAGRSIVIDKEGEIVAGNGVSGQSVSGQSVLSCQRERGKS